MVNIKTVLNNYISSAKQATIRLEQLERLFEGKSIEYGQFAQAIIDMEKAELLSEVRATGRTQRTPSLAYRYRINKHKLKQHFHQRLHHLRFQLHPQISLESYYALGEEIFDLDTPYIERINYYLHEKGLPDRIVAAPERSYALVGDEKWITDKNGKSLLIRIGLWDKLMIAAEYDPLMMAFNPTMIAEHLSKDPCLHLIVENKTTFQALLPILPETHFQTLIYGCGNKIVGNIEMFPKQFPIVEREHYFLYFGDIDYAGIKIWNDLSIKIEVHPAIPFYQACIQKSSAIGKEYQREDEQALRRFLAQFTLEDQHIIAETLANGCYYPQEILSTQELQFIWRETSWKALKQ